MRLSFSAIAATLALVGFGGVGMTPSAFAGADDGGNKAFSSEASQPAAATRPDAGYTATYTVPSKKTAPTPSAPADAADSYLFNHARGTMGN